MKKYILLIILMLAAGASANSKNAEEIFEKVQKVRGSEKFRQLNSISFSGKIITPNQEMTLSYYFKKPEMYRMELTGPTIDMKSTYDGKQGQMEMNGNQFPLNKPGVGQMQETYKTFEGLFSNYKEMGLKLEYVGFEQFNDVGVDVIKFSSENKQLKAKVFIDSEKYIILKSETENNIGSMNASSTVYFEDYRQMDGMMIPHKIIIEAQKKRSETVIEKFELNPKLKDSLFKLFDEVKE